MRIRLILWYWTSEELYMLSIQVPRLRELELQFTTRGSRLSFIRRWLKQRNLTTKDVKIEWL